MIHIPRVPRLRFEVLVLAAATMVAHQHAATARAQATPAARPAAAPVIAPDIYRTLPWRYIGPEGNRFTSAVGIPGDPSTFYVGSASGGVYKTTDGGVHWDAIFDDQPVQSIGSLAVARSDANVVWAGTGEAHIRSHISIGQGVYKSLDAGKNWSLMGLEKTGRVARMVIHPTNPEIVYACALGTAYGPQPERGVFRSTDGGATWTKTLFVDEKTGCSDLAMDPRNPRVLFAGMWQIEIHTWGRTSGGPGSGLFMSRDGGVTWKRLTGHGLPTKPVGKVALAIAPSNPDRIYAMIETGDGVPWNGEATESGQLWRSDDGGENWAMISADRNAMGRAHYYSRTVVNSDNENELYFLTASFAKSIDGGRTLTTLTRGDAPGGDHHDMWIDPTNGARMIVAHDQGLSISTNRGKTWFRQRLGNAQIYHVTVDNEIPYNVLGNKQDEPSYRGPSNSRLEGGGGGGIIPRAMWHSVGGGESGWATPDPTNSKLIWSTASGSGMVGGIVVRFEEDRRQFRNVEVWPQQLNGVPADHKYRFVWDAPLQISPHDHNTIYVGSQFVHRTQDGGQSWQVISPDLTLNDKSRQQSSGGLTPDNIGVEYSGVVYGLAESPKTKGEIWAGTNDGQLQLTRNNGVTWTNLTKNIPNLPAWGSLRSIVPSRHVAGTTYLTVDFHQENNRDPFVYKTTDYGATWRAITTGLPRNMVSYAKVIQEDPVKSGLLYLGTESAIYVSFDDGDTWQPLQNNLPHAPVSGIVVQEHFSDLVISTYGRGFFIMDDITPLRELNAGLLARPVNFFAPRAAYRFRPITAPSSTYDDPTVGQNPRYGASLTYYLKAPVAGRVTMTIADAKGTVVRTMTGTNTAGLNRVHWDLRYEPSAEVRLLTSPMYAAHIVTPPEGRVAPGTSQLSILAPPGTYTVTLRAGGAEQSQKLEVRKDPNTGGTEGDIAAQTTALLALRTSLNAAADAVRRIESVRLQLDAVARTVDDAALKKASTDLGAQLVDAEMNLVDLRQTGQGQDGVRFGSKLISKLGYLGGGVSSSDFRPTDSQEEVRTLLGDQLREQLRRIDTLLGTELERLNTLLKTRSIPNIIAPTPKPIGM
ncbi:MAG: sialidase [Gemmatimonadaceae bacterium]|nr:sialidase [Gemmatimonadaceae bacterium]